MFAAAPLIFLFVSELTNPPAGVAGTVCAAVSGCWLVYVGRGFGRNDNGGAASTLRVITLVIAALFATFALIKVFGPILEGHEVTASRWLVRLAGSVVFLLALYGFIRLQPPADHPYRFRPNSPANLAAIALILLSFIGFVVAALQVPAANEDRQALSAAGTESTFRDTPVQPGGRTSTGLAVPAPSTQNDLSTATPASLPPVIYQVISIPPDTLTEADCLRWASDFETDADIDPSRALSRNIIDDGVFARAAQGLKLSDAQVKSAKSLCMNLGESVADLGRNLIKRHPIKILSVKHTDRGWQATARVLLAQGVSDYLRMTIASDPSGKAKIVDFENISDGTVWSRFCRLMLLQKRIIDDAVTLQALSEHDRAVVSHASVLEEIYGKVRTRDFTGVSGLLRSLPISIQQEHYFAVLSVKAVIDAGKPDFDTAVAKALTIYPDDASVRYLQYQRALMRKQYDVAVTVLDNMNKAVGGDPFILALKANIYCLIERANDALAAAEAATRQDSTLTLPHRILLNLALADGNYVEVRRQLQILENDLAETIPELDRDPSFAGFVASADYTAWQANRKPAAHK